MQKQESDVYRRPIFYRAATGDRVKSATSISIDPIMLKRLKDFAVEHHMSVSQVVEGSVAAMLDVADNPDVAVREGASAPEGDA
jgi:hypothetical protein